MAVSTHERSRSVTTFFLAGDVMTGRAIDQILANPSEPELFEPAVRDARTYIALAERQNGPIPRAASPEYPWGDALAALDRRKPEVRIINLETSVTTSNDLDPKGINYRMHPRNIAVLTVADIDCCALANNHVLDWGETGLRETLATLRTARVRTAGAGLNANEARAPAVLDLTGGRRVLVISFGTESSGIPRSWAATPDGPGVYRLSGPHRGERPRRRFARRALEAAARRRGGCVDTLGR